MSLIIAIDQGTTSTRTVAFDRDLNIIHSQQKEYSLKYPNDGWVEIEPDELMASVYNTLDPVLEACSDIVALGITNQRETTLVWDASTGKSIYNAIVWQDRRTAEDCARLKKDGYEETIKNKTGLLLDPYFSATKISWILDNVDGARQKAANGELRFGTVDTYLLWQLSDGAIHKTDVTNASRTNLFNIHSKVWDQELLDIFNIPSSMLPDVHSSDSVFGEISRQNRTIKISGLIGDQQSALVGQKCFEPGQMKATFGTDLNGENWKIFQTEYDADQFYAYPNPFSPFNHNQLGSEGYVRFHTGSIANREVKLEIFNFAMEKVFDKVFSLDSYNGALKWDGRDLNGNHVSNGVYFIKMNYSQSANKSPQDYWNKLIVVK